MKARGVSDVSSTSAEDNPTLSGRRRSVTVEDLPAGRRTCTVSLSNPNAESTASTFAHSLLGQSKPSMTVVNTSLDPVSKQVHCKSTPSIGSPSWSTTITVWALTPAESKVRTKTKVRMHSPPMSMTQRVFHGFKFKRANHRVHRQHKFPRCPAILKCSEVQKWINHELGSSSI